MTLVMAAQAFLATLAAAQACAAFRKPPEDKTSPPTHQTENEVA